MILNHKVVSDPEAVILLSAWINYKDLHTKKRSMYGESGYSLPGFEWFLKSITKTSTKDLNESNYSLIHII